MMKLTVPWLLRFLAEQAAPDGAARSEPKASEDPARR
jgi:hypothetical protein